MFQTLMYNIHNFIVTEHVYNREYKEAKLSFEIKSFLLGMYSIQVQPVLLFKVYFI